MAREEREEVKEISQTVCAQLYEAKAFSFPLPHTYHRLLFAGTRFIVIRRTGEIICYHDEHGSGKKVLLRLKKRLGSVESNEGSKTDFTVSRLSHRML